MRHFPWRVGCDHSGSFDDDLAKDASGHRNRLGCGSSLIAHSSHDGHIASGVPPSGVVIVLPKDDRDVGRAGDEHEGCVGESDQYVVQLRRCSRSASGRRKAPATARRRVQSSIQAARARRFSEPRLLACIIIIHRDFDADHPVSGPEFDEVARLRA